MGSLTSISANQNIRIGIDATNIRIGGGITHLLELLNVIDVIGIEPLRIEQVCIWGGEPTLRALPNFPWLSKINPAPLNGPLWRRISWQIFSLSKAVRNAHCDVLFVPGGSYIGSFHPVVTMSQNLFPFEWSAIQANGWSLRSLKFVLLRWAQSYSFRHSDGVIFLTNYAQAAVLKVTGPLKAMCTVIAHGLNPRFAYQAKPQLSIDQYDDQHPYRLLYVSIIDMHKHQDQVILAVEQLRRKGYPLSLTLVGPKEPKAFAKMERVIQTLTPPTNWLQYLGAISYQTLEQEYQRADLGIFASSCETFGMIVLEKMSVGLPIACSERSSMHEILRDGGVYFDPLNPQSIAKAIEEYVLSSLLREQKRDIAQGLAKTYSWQNCAQQTIAFMHQVAQRNN
jgi:glycosyltransferase involved in cell wall biosynthesis